jgi:hypothetical protein
MKRVILCLLSFVLVSCTHQTTSNEVLEIEVNEFVESQVNEFVESESEAQEVDVETIYTLFSLENELELYGHTDSTKTLLYTSKWPMKNFISYENNAYFIRKGDLFIFNIETGFPDKIIDYSAIRDKNFPVPTEINELFIYKDTFVYRLTFDIYTYVVSCDLDGLNSKVIFQWYDDHHITELLSINEDRVTYKYKDIFDLEAPEKTGTFHVDGSNLRPNNMFMDFLNQ